MRAFNGTGVITMIKGKEVQKADGSPLQLTTMKIDVKDRVKINGQWNNYHTCLRLETTAFGGAAKFWADHFKQGDAVEVAGNIRVEEFDKNDGTKGYSIILEGQEGGSPYVKWLPKGFAPKEDEQPAPVESDSQEPPF